VSRSVRWRTGGIAETEDDGEANQILFIGFAAEPAPSGTLLLAFRSWRKGEKIGGR